jgi:hypothetical protein
MATLGISRRLGGIRWCLLVIAFIISAPLVYLWFTAPPDPIYEGVRLSEHLVRLYAPVRYTGRGFNRVEFATYQEQLRAASESRIALRSMGAEAIPLLSDWLTTETPAWKRVTLAIQKKFKLTVPRISADRASMALHALSEFPLRDPQFLSLLSAQLSRYDFIVSRAAASAFLRQLEMINLSISEREVIATRLFKAMAANEKNTNRIFNTDLLSRCIERCVLDQSLQNLLALEHGPNAFKLAAVTYFIDHPDHSKRVIPRLINNLASTNVTLVEYSARALSGYSGEAQPALASLTKIAAHPRPRVANAASNAIIAIRTSPVSQ